MQTGNERAPSPKEVRSLANLSDSASPPFCTSLSRSDGEGDRHPGLASRKWRGNRVYDLVFSNWAGLR